MAITPAAASGNAVVVFDPAGMVPGASAADGRT